MYKIRLADNTIDQQELDALADWVRGNPRLTMGELTLQLEETIARFLGGGHVIFVNSGSSANLLAMYGLALTNERARRSAIVPAISWVTTVSPAIHFGYQIAICDCDRGNLGLDVGHFESLCKTVKPSIVVLVHVLGHANHLDDIQRIADKYGITIMEDSCEAFGSTYKGRALGTFGKVGTFSFFYGHQLSTIEGGAIWTSDTELANVIRSLRAHGWARDVDAGTRSRWELEFGIDEFQSLYTFYHPGFNCRSSDLNAYIGLSQMKKAAHVAQRRQQNFGIYSQNLKSGFWQQTSDTETLSSFAFGTLVENRLELHQHLKAAGIESRPLVCGSIGRQPFWTRRYGAVPLPNADIVHRYGMYLPNHIGLTRADIEFVVHEFNRKAIPRTFSNSESLIAQSS